MTLTRTAACLTRPVIGTELVARPVPSPPLDGRGQVLDVFHAVRADLLRRLGRRAEAASAYEEAIARTDNAAERDFLRRRRWDLPDQS